MRQRRREVVREWEGGEREGEEIEKEEEGGVNKGGE